jgi:cellulose synthase/poly-beta-1,6-N-acetylglucosamine synthase-like glycosyltransferase
MLEQLHTIGNALVTLDQTLKAESPRLTPCPAPWRSVLIHAAVAVLWALALLGAIKGTGLLAWSAGVAYVVYDTLLLGLIAWQLRAKRPASASAVPVGRPKICVVIAAHNEARALPATLEALFAQTDAPDAVLIADDGSSDGTAELLARHFGFQSPATGTTLAASALCPNLHWLRLPRGGKARALNAALVHTSADIVLTVDADTLLDKRAIGAMRRAFAAEPSLVAATGVLTPLCASGVNGRLFQWFQTYEYVRNFLSRRAWMQLDSLLLVSGAFGGYRREALLAVGGFDPACLVEDYESIHRLRRHAVRQGLRWRCRVVADAVATTEAPGTLPAFLRQRRRWFAGFLQTQYWYREMVGAREYGTLGMLMLPVKAIDTLQPLYGLTAFGLLITFAALHRIDILVPIGGVMLTKVGIDLAFQLWSLGVYRRWTGGRTGAGFGAALAAALIEPFTFQLLRHAAAAWGWFSVLTGRWSWGHAVRLLPGMTAAPGGPQPAQGAGRP